MTVAINGRYLVSSFGGARRFAIELTERLARLRDDVVLLVPRLPDDVDLPDVSVQTVGRLSGPLWEQIELPLWLRRQGSPLLLNPATIVPFFYRHQISVVHDIAPAMRPQDFTRLFRLQWQLAIRLGMLRPGRRLVTISDASRRELAGYFRVDPSRIDLVYAGADSLVAAENAAPAGPASTSFLVFGRHGAAKNIRVVIDAAGKLPEASPLEVHLIGKLDPALEPYAREHAVPPERLVWTGPVSDEQLAEEYRGAIGFLWPSLHEGFGIPPVEAQSLGVPVIASDIPINREVLADSALYFPATDAQALADRMVELAERPELRTDLTERGRANARRFTWDQTAAGWNELVRKDEASMEGAPAS